MRPSSTLLPLLACTGCLLRDIDRHIAQLHCGEATTAGSDTGTTGCPDTTGEADTMIQTTTVDTTVDTTTGDPAGTDSDSADASSEAGEATDTSSSTGAPDPVCGNGVIEASGPEPEECDDANGIPDDGCSDCGRDRLVFITSADYQGSIFMGLEGADQRCRSLAAQQEIPNFAGFKAWLSDSKVSAGQRMFRGRGRYVLINGLVVAESWDALLAGALQNPINVTETSETKIYGVWTGTLPDGTAAVGADHCADWTGMLNKDTAFWGRSDLTTSQWTIATPPVDQPGVCSAEHALYCFEQE